jgi:hypothetical protein
MNIHLFKDKHTGFNSKALIAELDKSNVMVVLPDELIINIGGGEVDFDTLEEVYDAVYGKSD